jgi:hypothetical protein
MNKTIKEFSDIISREFQAWAKSNDKPHTTETFLLFLLEQGIIKPEAPSYYVIRHEYPFELYAHKARRFVAIQRLSAKYGVSERKIYDLLGTKHR